MRELQRDLAERYRALRDARSGPVFFIEHGLGAEEVADLVARVRSTVQVHAVEAAQWEVHPLPLIVAATEVGYRYRGSGTDFWPVLEDDLGIVLGGHERRRIRDLFAAASALYRGAEPPDTPWAQAFRLIVWPITHALAPLEFHRPLAYALSRVRVKAEEAEDATLHRALLHAAPRTSARLLTLLEDASLVIPMARSLLGGPSGELSPEVVQRIAADLAADHVARRSVAAARRIQRTTTNTGEPMARRRARQVPAVRGALQLRRRGDAFSLEAFFPHVEDAQLRQRLRRALRRRRFAPRLWGITARVPSEQLLSGLPFTLKLTSAPSSQERLLPGLEELDIDDRLREVLRAYELRLEGPLLFSIGAGGEVGRRVLGPNISGHRRYWALAEAATRGLKGLPVLGEVGPYTCYALDPAQEAARLALGSLGFTVRFGVSVAFAGSPTLDREASTPVFAVGDWRVTIPKRVNPGGVRVELDGEGVVVDAEQVVRVAVSDGAHLLRVSSGDESREYRFVGVSRDRAARPAVCELVACTGDLTVQALLSGRLGFEAHSFAPLEGLELTVEIESGGQRVGASAPLGPLPQAVSSETEPFASLLGDDTRRLLTQAPNATVRLRVGALCTRSWVLEHRVRPCWWSRDSADRVKLMSELGELRFGEVTENAPCAPPVATDGPVTEGTRLLAPLGLDVEEYGAVAEFTTLCVAPNRVTLDAPAQRKPRLVRRRRGSGTALGVEDLFEAYLRWSLAETETFIAEMRRRQVAKVLDHWSAELCCGEEWAAREEALSNQDPWTLLMGLCAETGLGLDEYVELSTDDRVRLISLSVDEIRRTQPGLWARVGPPSDLLAEDYEQLDLACGHAYVLLAAQYEARGNTRLASEIEQGDPGAAEDEWDDALGRVKTQMEFGPLAEMLLPSGSAHALMSLDSSVMTIDELAEELAAWSRVSRRALAGSPPSVETLRAALSLWAEPEVSAGLNWRGALDVMLAERSVSRAARYLALRSRQASYGGAR